MQIRSTFSSWLTRLSVVGALFVAVLPARAVVTVLDTTGYDLGGWGGVAVAPSFDQYRFTAEASGELAAIEMVFGSMIGAPGAFSVSLWSSTESGGSTTLDSVLASWTTPTITDYHSASFTLATSTVPGAVTFVAGDTYFITASVQEDVPGLVTRWIDDADSPSDLYVKITAIPEPSTYALIGGLAVLGFTVLRRRMRR